MMMRQEKPEHESIPQGKHIGIRAAFSFIIINSELQSNKCLERSGREAVTITFMERLVASRRSLTKRSDMKADGVQGHRYNFHSSPSLTLKHTGEKNGNCVLDCVLVTVSMSPRGDGNSHDTLVSGYLSFNRRNQC